MLSIACGKVSKFDPLSNSDASLVSRARDEWSRDGRFIHAIPANPASERVDFARSAIGGPSAVYEKLCAGNVGRPVGKQKRGGLSDLFRSRHASQRRSGYNSFHVSCAASYNSLSQRCEDISPADGIDTNSRLAPLSRKTPGEVSDRSLGCAVGAAPWLAVVSCDGCHDHH